ncbi:hypothetical protein E6R18_23270 [Streptomyces sp. A1277]|uniref:hypothetical protein n=1 Tax=Streptomyces sp. A1277 TaxID=2563103 RepID=UPI0010A298C5|nr:hypothetical protein [Streptomyces sp. A1277]THA29678.1 hypothetical protein E6R18_23270 [Streptomyces sp. A1277]
MNGIITAVLSAMTVGVTGLLVMGSAARQSRRAEDRTDELAMSIKEIQETLRMQGYEVMESARSQRLVPRLIERLPDEIAYRVWQDMKRRTQPVTNVRADIVHMSSADVSAERARLTQEIAHSLGTPLAQIEAAALSMESRSAGRDEAARSSLSSASAGASRYASASSTRTETTEPFRRAWGNPSRARVRTR